MCVCVCVCVPNNAHHCIHAGMAGDMIPGTMIPRKTATDDKAEPEKDEGGEDFPSEEDFPSPSDPTSIDAAVKHDESGLFNPPAGDAPLGTEESRAGE